VVWYKDGGYISIGNGNSINISTSESYTFKSTTNICGSEECFPIIVQTEICCTGEVEICTRINAKKIRN
jgi:hypothetical protein